MLKRLIDILVSAICLVLLAPLFALVALAIKLDSAGPVFFRQDRVGLHGRIFRIFKFRTMIAASASNPMQLTVAGDPRITRIGHLLRRSKLDELPQMIDVLRGTMSLVGPRPEVPKYVEHYPSAWRERLLSVRPGVTDFASVHYRNENELLVESSDPEYEYINVILPSKLKYSLHYVEHQSLTSDFQVLGLTLKTIMEPALLTARNAMRITDTQFWSRLEQSMSSLSKRNRAYAMFADALMVLLCWHMTYLFRLGFERWQPGRPWYDDYVSAGVVATYVLCMSAVGMPRSPWRFFGFDDFRRLTMGCLLAGLISACWILFAQLSGVARAVLVLHPMFCILLLSLARMGYRLMWEHARNRAGGEEFQSKRAIIMGSGEVARRLVAAIHQREGWTILAMLDDEPAKQGLRISGVRVQGCFSDVALPHVLAGATHVLIALEGNLVRERALVVEIARRTGLVVMAVEDGLPLKEEI